VIDGFNIPMQLSSTSNGCNKVLNCRDSNCPDAYHQPNDVKTVTCPGGTNYRVVFCPWNRWVEPSFSIVNKTKYYVVLCLLFNVKQYSILHNLLVKLFINDFSRKQYME